MTHEPLDQVVGMIFFVSSFCFMVYFLRAAWRSFLSPEFHRDLEKLRDNRRRRRAARRHR